MGLLVISPSWDKEGKFFIIDEQKKGDIVIEEVDGESTYAIALPEIQKEIIGAFFNRGALSENTETDKYIFRMPVEDWYIAEVELK